MYQSTTIYTPYHLPRPSEAKIGPTVPQLPASATHLGAWARPPRTWDPWQAPHRDGAHPMAARPRQRAWGSELRHWCDTRGLGPRWERLVYISEIGRERRGHTAWVGGGGEAAEVESGVWKERFEWGGGRRKLAVWRDGGIRWRRVERRPRRRARWDRGAERACAARNDWNAWGTRILVERGSWRAIVSNQRWELATKDRIFRETKWRFERLSRWKESQSWT